MPITDMGSGIYAIGWQPLLASPENELIKRWMEAAPTVSGLVDREQQLRFVMNLMERLQVDWPGIGDDVIEAIGRRMMAGEW